MKLTAQQKKVLEILKNNPQIKLGDLRQRFYSIHTPNSTRLSNVMKRNSRMSSWMNQLCEKGLVDISYIQQTYKASDKALLLLENQKD